MHLKRGSTITVQMICRSSYHSIRMSQIKQAMQFHSLKKGIFSTHENYQHWPHGQDFLSGYVCFQGNAFGNRGAHTIREVAKETHVSPSITLASAVTHFLTVLESVKGQVCDGTKGMQHKFGNNWDRLKSMSSFFQMI
jgi:hypothetical protein